MSERAFTEDGLNLVDHLEEKHGEENVHASCGGVVVSHEH